jgi:hypothetical protein
MKNSYLCIVNEKQKELLAGQPENVFRPDRIYGLPRAQNGRFFSDVRTKSYV